MPMFRVQFLAVPILLAGSIVVAAQDAPVPATDSRAHAPSSGPADGAIKAEVQKALKKKQFSGVDVAVDHGVVTLGGQVEIYNDKRDAERKAHRGDVSSVVDQIRVDPPAGMTDAILRAKVGKGLIYDRVGYGTTVYNSFTLFMDHGVATVGGVVYEPADKISALDLVGNTPGVVDIVDRIQVAPPSPLDDRIRRAMFQAIYGYPSLNRYAIDPAKPIRITVVNGNATLTGVVDSQGDKDAAYLRASGVAGAFSVKNDLQVQGQQPEK